MTRLAVIWGCFKLAAVMMGLATLAVLDPRAAESGLIGLLIGGGDEARRIRDE